MTESKARLKKQSQFKANFTAVNAGLAEQKRNTINILLLGDLCALGG